MTEPAYTPAEWARILALPELQTPAAVRDYFHTANAEAVAIHLPPAFICLGDPNDLGSLWTMDPALARLIRETDQTS